MRKYLIYSVVFISMLISCTKKNKEYKTESGTIYILYNDTTNNPKIRKGDYVTLHMIYRNDKDSILYDSRKVGEPLRFRLDNIPFRGSFEEVLTNLRTGDSATIYVSADSMYHYLFEGGGVKEPLPQSETALTKGSKVRFDLKVLNVQTYQEVEQEIVMGESAKDKAEKELISKYVAEHHIEQSADTQGYYLVINKRGTGARVDSGKIVAVEYEGRFLTGEVFDGTKKAGRPYRFVKGAKHVIPAWEAAFGNLREGDQVTIVVPSKLAYGAEGIRRPQDATYIVPPFTPLVFDINVLSVKDIPSATGR